MDAATEARMLELVSDEFIRPVMERLSEGGVTDEGEKHGRKGRVEWDAGARLWLMENPDDSVPEPWRSLGINLAKQKSAKDRLRAAELFGDPNAVPPPELFDYASDGDARDLAAADFYTEVSAGAELLVQQGWSRYSYPEQEYMRQKAERESGWRRAYKSQGAERSEQEAEYHRLFNRFDRRYRFQAEKHRAKRRKQRETTNGLPV